MSTRKLRNRSRWQRSRAATALAMVGALTASFGLIALSASPAMADSPCPATGGWTKTAGSLEALSYVVDPPGDALVTHVCAFAAGEQVMYELPVPAATYTVTSGTAPWLFFNDNAQAQNLSHVAYKSTATRTLPAAPVPVAPGCATDGSLTLPGNADGLTWTIVRDGGAAAGTSPYGPGVYDVTVTSATLPFEGGGLSHTFENVVVAAATGDCPNTTTTTVSEERKTCAAGVEGRTGTVRTVNGQAQAPQWGPWSFVRALSNAEFDQLGCRPGQPDPVELLGAETRMDCAGVEQRESTQVTTFEWNEDTREYEQVVGAVEWSDWVKVRNLTNKELRAEGCVLGEETLVPEPKPEDKPTVKGVERVAPPAAVPTAVAAGAAGEVGSASQLVAQLLVGGGLLLLLAGGWVGFGRREAGAHEA